MSLPKPSFLKKELNRCYSNCASNAVILFILVAQYSYSVDRHGQLQMVMYPALRQMSRAYRLSYQVDMFVPPFTTVKAKSNRQLLRAHALVFRWFVFNDMNLNPDHRFVSLQKHESVMSYLFTVEFQHFTADILWFSTCLPKCQTS